ncbi:MAG: DUF3341 domain-containing protein [Pyrinomonadaceae bacterium]|nr:DUF3341 domain-containing protein [Pyrinomonadaceae bacterium]
MRSTNTAHERFTAAYFDNEDDLVASAAEARLRGLEIYDAFTPFPVHGLDDAVGIKPSRLTWVAFCGGLLGLLTAIGLQVWTSAYAWALNIGGKPFNSVPLWVPVAFELTVLFAGLSAIGALFIISGLHPFSKRKSLEGVNDGNFVLVLKQPDGSYDSDRARSIFNENGAFRIEEGLEF